MSLKFDFNTLATGFEADWPVIVGVPVDGGKIEEREFMARFRTLTPEEQDQIEADEDMEGRLKASVQRGFVGLGAGETDKTPPAELFEILWRHPPSRLGLIRAYGRFSTGSPAKN